VNDAFGLPQSAVVIGGTSDIALAILSELVPRGCTHIVLAGRDPGGLAKAADTLRTLGATTVVEVVCDASDMASAAPTVAACHRATPEGIDLVLMAVGQLGQQEGDEGDPSRTAEMVGVNFAFPAAVLAGLADVLRRQGRGRIVVLSSVAGVRLRRANFLYGATKSGLDAYTRGLADALVGSGVRVHVVRPGFVHSKMTAHLSPAPFATTPDVVAQRVVRGLETNEDVIWAPSILRWVFGVFRLLPRSVWRKLPA
jgi:decaprenylphospho-beta-D-erythro-pentofuranosid-2-ulose 2-reductase